MLKIGLTGGIGSGKTTVAKIFEVLGIPVYYADDAAKKLMNTDPALKEQIIQHFGSRSYINGELDRKYMAAIVFTEKAKLELLNSLTHPATIRDAEAWMKKIADSRGLTESGGQNPPYIIKEAALLFESGANRSVDQVIGVAAPLSLRVERTMKRDKLAKEDVLKRISRQMDEEEKLKRCDHVIVNDEEQLLVPQVLDLHKKFST